MAVNETPTLKQVSRIPICQVGKGIRNEQADELVKKNKMERVKQGGGTFHLERMGSLFKVERSEQSWTRAEVPSFSKMVSVVGRFE